jgi:hypothetical protein
VSSITLNTPAANSHVGTTFNAAGAISPDVTAVTVTATPTGNGQLVSVNANISGRTGGSYNAQLTVIADTYNVRATITSTNTFAQNNNVHAG